MTMSKRISAANRVLEAYTGYRGTRTLVRAMLEAADLVLFEEQRQNNQAEVRRLTDELFDLYPSLRECK